MQADRESHELSWNGKRKFQIERRVFENPNKDICSFYLVPHDNRPIPPFNAGQFLTFELQVPGEAQPVVRCYSLSDSPLQRDYYRVTTDGGRRCWLFCDRDTKRWFLHGWFD